MPPADKKDPGRRLSSDEEGRRKTRRGGGQKPKEEILSRRREGSTGSNIPLKPAKDEVGRKDQWVWHQGGHWGQ